MILRDEALLILDKRGAILETAREVSRLLNAAGIPARVIGGVAVVLHGHVRTTKDVDILVEPPLEPVEKVLTNNGFQFDRVKREFVKEDVPVHLVLPGQVRLSLHKPIEIEGIMTVQLGDLIAMKLRAGTTELLRAQDLADVIGLIRHHQLKKDYVRHLDKSLRGEFRKLVDAVEREA